MHIFTISTLARSVCSSAAYIRQRHSVFSAFPSVIHLSKLYSQPCRSAFSPFNNNADVASRIIRTLPAHRRLILLPSKSGQPIARVSSNQIIRRIHARSYQAWEQEDPNLPSRWRLLLRPFLFSAAFVVGCTSLAAILKDERMRRTRWTWFPKEHHDFWGWHLTTGQLVSGSIIAVNTVVFACWQWTLRGIETLDYAAPWLRRNFLLNAFSGRGLPLLCSAFSHVTFLHLAFNMIALWSLAPPFVKIYGPENFVAAYTSAAVLSSLGASAVKIMTRCTRPSLGASGALMYLLSSTALIWPQAQFGLIFLPGLTFAAPQMLAGIVCMDLAGLVLGWRMFDHGAHLAGCALGWAMVKGGGWGYMLEWQREVIAWYRRLGRPA